MSSEANIPHRVATTSIANPKSLTRSIDGDLKAMNVFTSIEESSKQKRAQRNRKTSYDNFSKQRSSRNNQGTSRISSYQNQVQNKNSWEKYVQQSFRAVEPPLRQHTKLNLTESQLFQCLQNYVLDEHLMRMLGFPIEYDVAPTLAIIYKYPPYEFFSQHKPAIRSLNTTFNNNDPIIVNINDGLNAAKDDFKLDTNDSDSGQGSGSSSPSEDLEINPVISASPPALSSSVVSSKKECSRCGKGFYVTECGQYVTTEPCLYHWGKLSRVFDGQIFRNTYSCCNRDFEVSNQSGCTANRVHVWTGVSVGMNGPYEGFVQTRQRPASFPLNEGPAIFALDCEMCFTACGLELAKVSIIRSDGNLFYESFVRPERDVVDYNTRFSGITEKDLIGSKKVKHSSRDFNYSKGSSRSKHCSKHVRTLKEVQKDLLKFIFADTILIGHSIDNDLKALKMIHKTIIDTSISFPHFQGLPMRRSLKALTKTVLKRDIQQSETGHCSFEDARATLELMLWKVRKDLRTFLDVNLG